VDTVATAFRSGRYIDISTGTSFGSGEYGNMGAMVAALLLDRESRSVVLDADPASGSVMEPILRFVRLMKSLEFVPDSPDRNFQMSFEVMNWIEQMPYAHPSVFSFFLPDFQPAGTCLASPQRLRPNWNVEESVFSLELFLQALLLAVDSYARSVNF
jgi:cullin-associated NEDD8-dissociated protein 1